MLQKFFTIILFSVMLCSRYEISLEAHERAYMPITAKAFPIHFMRGHRGFRGHHGHHGHRGHRGHHGERGDRGKRGRNGVNGVTGATGATGAIGATGATGATGAAGTGGVSLVNGDVSGPSSVVGGVVQFPNTVSLPAGVAYNGNDTFTILTAGDYRISYAISYALPAGTSEVQYFLSIDSVNTLMTTRDTQTLQNMFVTVIFEGVFSLSFGATVQVNQVIVQGGAANVTDGNFLVMKLSS